MIIFPAINLQHGQLMLPENSDVQSNYSNDPIKVAEMFVEEGAEWLHVVNLDSTYKNETNIAKNTAAIQSILDNVDIPVQVTGGVRTLTDIGHLLDMGVSRVVLGKMALERSRQIPNILGRFGAEQIAVRFNIEDGQATIKTNIEQGEKMHALGVKYAVYTNVKHDGTITNINIETSKTLGENVGLRIIISGKCANLNDIRQIKALESYNIEGLIIDWALYTNKVKLSDALKIA
ncbi:MAG: hypothetical protein B6242_06755 [Anaerolineaceae bacterium 4572_78]|nr:MAG: hypothetical protein B6242_06755 [Anaerolineaceae bacterium 4572_78]